MKGQVPDFRVNTVVSDPETGKDRWTNIGVAFVSENAITVLMDATPVNGKLVLVRPKPKAE